MLGTLAQALTLVRAGFFPKGPSDLGVDAELTRLDTRH